jgi:hypothetical protein
MLVFAFFFLQACHSENICEPDNLRSETFCSDSKTYWIDSCGDLGELIEKCKCGCADHARCQTECRPDEVESCGNGEVEGEELCDGNCPEACDDLDPCTDDVLLGSQAECTAQCVFEEKSCVADRVDGCCPGSCDSSNDADCALAVPEEACQYLAPVSGQAESAAIAFSNIHTKVRFFGDHNDYRISDQALIDSLADERPIQLAHYVEYAKRLSSVCLVFLSSLAANQTHVEQNGEILIVRPGEQEIQWPDPMPQTLVLDLRNLVDHNDLAEQLEAAIGPALMTPAVWPKRLFRGHGGMTDEYFAPNSVYYNRKEISPVRNIPASGTTDTHIILWTSDSMPAVAIRFAMGLRMNQRAWVVGADLHAVAGESMCLTGIQLAVCARVMELVNQQHVRYPDSIPADSPLDPFEALDDLQGTPEPVITNSQERPNIVGVSPYGLVRQKSSDLATARAALLVAHGSGRLFSPYLENKTENLDQLLLETLGLVEDKQAANALDRASILMTLRRLGHGLEDGHTWLNDQHDPWGSTGIIGALAFKSEVIDGIPTVRDSLVDALQPGDRIISIDGLDTQTWMQQEMELCSGATLGYLQFGASQELFMFKEPIAFVLEDTDGNLRDVGFQTPSANNLVDQIYYYGASNRVSGPLDDYDAPDIYYINLDGSSAPATQALYQHLQQASEQAVGLILDMRGHPTGNGQMVYDPYDLLSRIIEGPFYGLYYNLLKMSPWGVTHKEQVYDMYFTPKYDPHFHGPVVMMVDYRAVSAGEDSAGMFVQAGRGITVGRQTAGTTGSVTGIQLPGGFAMTMTGMETLWRDGSPFHGIGVIPDIEVSHQAAYFRDGLDADIIAAIQYLTTR